MLTMARLDPDELEAHVRHLPVVEEGKRLVEGDCPDFTELAKKLEPAVVKIFAYSGITYSTAGTTLSTRYYLVPSLSHGTGLMIDSGVMNTTANPRYHSRNIRLAL